MSARIAFLLLPLLMAAGPVVGETPPDVDLDLMQAPASPAFVLLGIEAASIERPGDPTDLAVSLMTATDELSVLPENYAASFAPYWLLGFGHDVTFEEWRRGGGVWTSIKQTADVSLAATSREGAEGEPAVTSLGLGVRFSLVRGHVPETVDASLRELEEALLSASATANELVMRFEASDSVLTRIAPLMTDLDLPENVRDELSDIYQARRQQLLAEAEATLRADHGARLRELATSLDFTRVGFKLDLAAGLTGDFPGRETDAGRIGRGGAWLTGGWESTRFSGLVVARWLSTNQLASPNTTSRDLGLRLGWDGGDRFRVAGEFLGRWFDDDASLDDTWRVCLIADYDVGRNRTLSFSFGRDFEGEYTGNLVAAVQLILGFGADRLGGAGG